MEKVKVVFNKPTGDVLMDMVVVRFKYEEQVITMFTNLIQHFLFMDDETIVPRSIAEKPSRMFTYKGKRLIEYDDLMYAVKYRLNNGQIYNHNCTLIYLRIEEAINNLKKPDKRELIVKCLNSNTGK